MALTVKTVDGELLDTVSLSNGKLKYKTGEAKSIFEGKRLQDGKKLSDADIYALLTDFTQHRVNMF